MTGVTKYVKDENNDYSAYCEDHPGKVGYGRSELEAENDLWNKITGFTNRVDLTPTVLYAEITGGFNLGEAVNVSIEKSTDSDSDSGISGDPYFGPQE